MMPTLARANKRSRFDLRKMQECGDTVGGHLPCGVGYFRENSPIVRYGRKSYSPDRVLGDRCYDAEGYGTFCDFHTRA